MSVFPTLPLIVLLLSQAPPPGSDRRVDLAARLEFMKKSVATFDLHSTDDPRVTYRLKAEPVLRFTDPAGGRPRQARRRWPRPSDRPPGR